MYMTREGVTKHTTPLWQKALNSFSWYTCMYVMDGRPWVGDHDLGDHETGDRDMENTIRETMIWETTIRETMIRETMIQETTGDSETTGDHAKSIGLYNLLFHP